MIVEWMSFDDEVFRQSLYYDIGTTWLSEVTPGEKDEL